MQFVTDFADQAVALPVALCVAAWLAWSGWRRGVILWLVALACVLAGVLVLKLVVLGCAPGTSPLLSPSGHTGAAVFVYGGIATLAARLRPGMAILAGLGLAILFGTTRVLLHVHTLADVFVGGGVGLAVLAGFAWLALPVPPGPRPVRLLLICLPVVLLLHGIHLDLEPRLRGAGHWLGLTICPGPRA